MKNIKDPLYIGMPISNKNNECGTLGAFVMNRDNKPCILSCNHVLAGNGKFINNNDPTTIEVYYPGNTKKYFASNNRHIANVEYWNHLKKNKENYSDSAYANLLKDVEYLGNVIPQGFGFQFEGEKIFLPSSGLILDKGTAVYKIGYASGFTTGVIQSESSDSISIDEYIYSNLIKVKWQSESDPFSLNGDSGSMAFIRKNEFLYAIGMVFAGIDYENKKLMKRLNKDGIMPFSYLCNIYSVLDSTMVMYPNN